MCQYGYMTRVFLESPWWGEINPERSGVDVVEMSTKRVKRGGNG